MYCTEHAQHSLPYCLSVCLSVCLSLSLFYVGRDSSVDIATRYELDDPRIEPRYRRYFPHLSRPVVGPTQPPIQLYRVSFQGVKRSGRGFDHPSSSSAEVKERVELCISMACQRANINYAVCCMHQFVSFISCGTVQLWPCSVTTNVTVQKNGKEEHF
jgi:hypothetical protein